MPVHNALPYLDEAVQSILDQSFADFEFVILDDASTDGSRERLKQWAAKDRRIRIIAAESNLGPAGSSDRVARAALAPIVARMDADDVSHPKRLARQIDVLEQNPPVGLVASFYDVMDSQGRRIRAAESWRAMRRSPFVPFAHGTIMYRKSLYERVGGYRAECEYWEDQDLIARMALESEIRIIPETLYRVRQSTVSTRAASSLDRVERAVDLMYRCTARLTYGQGYDDLLHTPPTSETKLDPRVFLAVGSVYLWAGMRPRLFGRFLKRARLSLDATTASTMLWTLWAFVSPSSLRAFMKVLLGSRNAVARTRLGDAPIAWHPFNPAE
jgi:glycosyltransferase involved in cell wall biosynthesis